MKTRICKFPKDCQPHLCECDPAEIITDQEREEEMTARDYFEDFTEEEKDTTP